MKSLKLIFFGLILIGLNAPAFGQKLLPGAYTFSKKKIAYITLNDGTEVEGNIKDIDRKKGLIKSIKIKDVQGEKQEFKASDISSMYLAPSGWDNFGKMYDFMYDPTKWDNDNYKQGLLKEGYAYFEQAEVEMGRKTRVLLMQLLNPSFSSKIKVYMDPWASETTSVGVGGFKLAGGDKKSYYVKDGERMAFLLKKKDYKDNFNALFGDCKKMLPLKKGAKWSQFDQHVFDFTSCN